MSVRRIERQVKRHEVFNYDFPSVLFRVMDKSDYVWDHLGVLRLCELPKICVFAHALEVNGWKAKVKLPNRDGDKHTLIIRRSHERKLQ